MTEQQIIALVLALPLTYYYLLNACLYFLGKA